MCASIINGYRLLNGKEERCRNTHIDSETVGQVNDDTSLSRTYRSCRLDLKGQRPMEGQQVSSPFDFVFKVG